MNRWTLSRMLAAAILPCVCVLASTASADEITVEVKPDNSVHIQEGYLAEQIASTDSGGYDSQDTSRITINFPMQNPAVYELDSQEDIAFVVDGWLPEGAEVRVRATNRASGSEVEAFEHVISGGDWLILSKYMNKLPLGENNLSVTLRTPGRPDAVVSHPFYVLEPRDLDSDPDPDWFDWEQDNDPDLGPIIPGEGFMSFNPPAGTQIYYVSASGSDGNSGLSPEQPLRTLRKAYDKIRDDSTDWILLKAGDTFEGGFGSWGKSGKSAESPIHVGVYGEGDRPIVRTNGEGFWRAYGEVSNVRFDGIYAYANGRLESDGSDMAWKEYGFFMYGKGKNIVIHDCKVEGFLFNVVFQGYDPGAITGIVLYRTILNNSFGHWDGTIAGHSSGIFLSKVENAEIVECTFDHNGWNPDVGGASRTKFNHNIYIQKESKNVNVRRSIVTRGASHGLQLRCGGAVQDSLFVRNALGFFVSLNSSVVTDNVVMQSDDITDKEIRGQGFAILPVEDAIVTGNIVTQKLGRAGWMSGIQVAWEECIKQIDSFDVEMRNNIVWNWEMNAPHSALKFHDSARINSSNNVVDGINQNGSRVVYRNPNVSFDSYIEGGFSEFLKGAVMRRRNEWNPQFAAPTFNAYMQEGFTPASGGGSV